MYRIEFNKFKYGVNKSVHQQELYKPLALINVCLVAQSCLTLADSHTHTQRQKGSTLGHFCLQCHLLIITCRWNLCVVIAVSVLGALLIGT